MPAIDFDAERTYEEERFSAQEVFRTDHSKVVCGYFEPGQFTPPQVTSLSAFDWGPVSFVKRRRHIEFRRVISWSLRGNRPTDSS
jgi:hypothetical protein